MAKMKTSIDSIYFKNFLSNPQKRKSDLKGIGLFIVLHIVVIALLFSVIFLIKNKKEYFIDNYNNLSLNNFELEKNSNSNDELQFDIEENNCDESVSTEETINKVLYLDQIEIVESDRYTGNEGDSFVYPIGQHENSRGNTCDDGKTYEHGIECWIARWNGTYESSWAYSVFNLENKYRSVSGECKLINSYNMTDFDTTLDFYSEDGLIQSYRLTPETIPFSINLDVSNCQTLKISVYDNEPSAGGTSFGLVDMMFDCSTSDEHNSNHITNEDENIVNSIKDFKSHLSSVTSSSQLMSESYGNQSYDYSPRQAVDNEMSTCWCEGKDDYGIGESITLMFDDTYSINELDLWNGLCTNEDLFYKNSRLKQFSIVLSNGISYDFDCIDGWENRNSIFSFEDNVETSSITIIIKSVYEGSKYMDTCISEISIK